MIPPVSSERIIKSLFFLQTSLHFFVTYRDTQDRSPYNPSLSEWDVCWPIATWYMSWHLAICLSVISLSSKLFKLDVEETNLYPPSPDWGRFTILLLWYLAGFPVAYGMRGICSAEAPGIWGRALRVFIEGIVGFGLSGSVYGLCWCLFPTQPRSRVMVAPFLSEQKSPAWPAPPEPLCVAV